MRKTIEVNKVLAMANKLLSNDNISQDQKAGICTLLEEILHDTGHYRGFNYSYWLDQGCEEWIEAGRPDDNSQYLGPEYSRTYYSALAG